MREIMFIDDDNPRFTERDFQVVGHFVFLAIGHAD